MTILMPLIAHLKPQGLDLDHVWQSADGIEDRRSERLVDLDESDGVPSRTGTPEVECGNIHFGSAKRVAKRANEARLVVIPHEQHVAAELGFERDPLDRHD